MPAKEVRAILKKIFKKDVTYLMSDVASARESAIAVGLNAFDYGLLGIGGVPRGHFFELYGDPKAGKTTMLLHLISAVQRQGVVPIVMDSKGAVTTDTERAKRIGVDLDECIIFSPYTAEEVFETTRKSLFELKKHKHDVAFFWDDMGITPVESEIDTKKDKVKVGSKASTIWHFCRSLAGDCYKTGTTMVVVNQLTAKINTGWVPIGTPTETTMGGGGLRYTARIRVNLKASARKVKERDRVVAQIVNAKTEANAFFPPLRTVQLYLDYVNGYSCSKSTLLNGLNANIIRKDKDVYNVKGGKGLKFKENDIPEETVKVIERKLWPWIDGDMSSIEDYSACSGTKNDNDFDSDESEDDDFSKGYID